MASTRYVKKDLCIFSYNSRGFSEDKQEICRQLMTETERYFPILCNQENFLLKGNSYKVKQCLPGTKIVFKKAEKEMLEGRPRNGMFIAIPTGIAQHVVEIPTNHWRVQAVIISAPQHKILLVNSYFPTDPKVNDFDTGDLFSTLEAITRLIDETEHDSIFWGGDINADFSRGTFFTNTIDDYLNEAHLERSWKKYQVDFTHCFELENRSYTSVIDHFFWSVNINESVRQAEVLHLPSNTSDHSPIYCIINIGTLQEKSRIKSSPKLRPSWRRATDEEKVNYKNILEIRLENMGNSCAEMCKDVHCKRHCHTRDIDKFLEDILESIESSAASCLPKPKKKKQSKPVIRGWKDEVEPFRDKAMFWHAVWQSAGRPLNTELHKIMKKTRNTYHLQIRKQRRIADMMKKNTLLTACIDEGQDIFAEIRKIRRTEQTSSTTIDGKDSEIENHFGKMYEELYNSIDDRAELEEINERLQSKIDSSSIDEISKVTSSVVSDAINCIKSDKTDPLCDFTSDCLKQAPFVLCEKLSQLFQMYLVHGYVSASLMVSTLIPLVKDKLGDMTSSSNYRSIALSSLILKIFDWVVLLLYGDGLWTDDLQFGFQEQVSTNMCTWLVLETLNHFAKNGSEVFICVMDMKKAFDLVKQSKLFEKLMTRNIPPVVLRLLLDMYRKQEANVRWNSSISRSFPMSNGVKQGAVLSPRLYCIYMDDLFAEMRRRKTGCWVGDTFGGIVGYADDLLLMAPTLDSLQEMITTCERYAVEHNLVFSTHPKPIKCKTKCLASLKKDRELKKLRLGGMDLPWVTSAKHLGCTIEASMNMKKDLMEKRAIYINRVNELSQEFYFAHPTVKVKLNNIFNSYFYGSSLWDLFGSEATRLEKTWNISQRMMLNLPRNSHRYFVEPLSQTPHIMCSLYGRFLKFVVAISESPKKALRNMLNYVKLDCRTTTGGNLRRMMLLAGKTSVDELTTLSFKSHQYMDVPQGEEWRIHSAKEMLEIMNGERTVPNFCRDEIEEMMIHVVVT